MTSDDTKIIMNAVFNHDVQCIQKLVALPHMRLVFKKVPILEIAANRGNVEILKLIAPLVSETQRLKALSVASEYNHPTCVEYLLSGFTPEHQLKNKAAATNALSLAAQNDCVECLRLLLPFSDPTFSDSQALCFAAYYGSAECLSFLIPVSSHFNEALENAASQGNNKCVELLIPVSDVSAKKHRALWLASKYGHVACVDLLAPLGGGEDILQSLQREYPTEPNQWQHLQEVVDQLQRKRIAEEIESLPNNPVAHSKRI